MTAMLPDPHWLPLPTLPHGGPPYDGQPVLLKCAYSVASPSGVFPTMWMNGEWYGLPEGAGHPMWWYPMPKE